MNAKLFEVKILLNKDPKKGHTDATKPQLAKADATTGLQGKYYHVSVTAPMVMKNGFAVPQQTKSIAFPIFETGTRNEIFKNIEEVLSDPANYTIVNGDVKLNRTAMGMEGDLVVEEVDFAYEMTNSDGTKIIDPLTKKPRLRRSIQMFIFASEDEQGLTDVIMAAEETRARRHAVVTEEENGTGQVTVQ